MRAAPPRAGGGAGIADIHKIDAKLRSLRRIEASHHAAIRRALEASRLDTVDPVKARKKYEKVKAKVERKIKKISPKIKALTNRRAELKGDRAAKG